MSKIISIIGSLVILAIGIYLAIQPSIKTTASTFIKALAEQNYDTAYDLLSDSKKSKYGGRGQFEQFVQNHQFEPVKWDFSMKNQRDLRRNAVKGYANLKNGKMSNFYIKASERNGEWYIDEFEFTK